MPATQNPVILFNEIPKGKPTETTFKYDESKTIDLDNAPLDGGVLTKNICVSLDPYQRGKLRSEEIKSYTPAYPLHSPIANFGVGLVLRSENPKYKKGDHVYGYFNFEKYSIHPSTAQFLVVENKENLPWTVYVGAAGMPGKTGIYGWKEFSQAKAGETAFVSAGSGPVGQMVIQTAKAQGLKVITSAGSDEKVKYLKEVLGADVAFNYKTEDEKAILEKEGPIDVNWVNVGGEAFETELQYMNDGGRCIFCGWISGYNGESYGVKNLFQVVARRLQFNGFIVSDLEAKYSADFYKTVPAKLAFGDIKFKEHIYKGLDVVPKAFRELFDGVGFGKVVVVIADDE